MKKFKLQTTSFSLHIMAMLFMLCDHMWGISLVNHDVFTCIGRLAFPIYAFMLVEGYFHTGNLRKYVMRLLVFAVLSEIPFNLVAGSRWFYPIHQNVLWTFLIALAIATICIGYIGGIITFVDYNGAGILMVLTFYFFRGKKWWNYLGQLVCMWYINVKMLEGFGYELDLWGNTYFIARQGLALLALLPIWLYGGKQGLHSKKLQYVYYAFYPVHLLVLGIIKFL